MRGHAGRVVFLDCPGVSPHPQVSPFSPSKLVTSRVLSLMLASSTAPAGVAQALAGLPHVLLSGSPTSPLSGEARVFVEGQIQHISALPGHLHAQSQVYGSMITTPG